VDAYGEIHILLLMMVSSFYLLIVRHTQLLQLSSVSVLLFVFFCLFFTQGLDYDCQGTGEYVLSKSLDSAFETQGRFDKFLSDQQATVTRAITIQTGRKDEPKFDLVFDGCTANTYLDGKKINIDAGYGQYGTQATHNPGLHMMAKGNERWFYYSGSKVLVHIRKKNSKVMGCYTNTCVCIPDDLKAERIVGLFGSPNGDMADDFMAMDGTNLEHGGKTTWADAYNYCHDDFCIRDQAFSMFGTPMSATHCDAPYDPKLENEVANASPELKAICGDDVACLIEGAAGGIEDSADSVQTQRDLGTTEAAPTDSDTDPNPADYNSVFQKTVVVPAPISGNPTKTDGANVKGDPHLTTWAGRLFDVSTLLEI